MFSPYLESKVLAKAVVGQVVHLNCQTQRIPLGIVSTVAACPGPAPAPLPAFVRRRPRPLRLRYLHVRA